MLTKQVTELKIVNESLRFQVNNQQQQADQVIHNQMKNMHQRQQDADAMISQDYE